MPPPLPDFGRLLGALNREGVKYVLVGGLAMIARGSDYITQDLDVGYARTPENYISITAALRDMRPLLRGAEDAPFILDDRTFKNTLNLTLITEAGGFDLLGEMSGIASFSDLWDRADWLELYGHMVKVASIDDLMSMKAAAGREKDLSHLKELATLKALINKRNQGADE